MNLWTISTLLSVPVVAVGAYAATELLFWCFCWAFCKVDGSIQNWDVKKVKAEDIEEMARQFHYRDAV